MDIRCPCFRRFISTFSSLAHGFLRHTSSPSFSIAHWFRSAWLHQKSPYPTGRWSMCLSWSQYQLLHSLLGKDLIDFSRYMWGTSELGYSVVPMLQVLALCHPLRAVWECHVHSQVLRHDFWLVWFIKCALVDRYKEVGELEPSRQGPGKATEALPELTVV